VRFTDSSGEELVDLDQRTGTSDIWRSDGLLCGVPVT